MREFLASGRGKLLLTTGVSYGYFGSVLLATAITIPLALHYLGSEQYGLWAVSSQLLSYILLFDGGLARSLRRLVGESVADPENISAVRRFCTLVGLSFVTACLLLLVAILVSNWSLRFLSVPPHLLGIGRELFLSIMALQCIGYMLGPYDAVLFAQNRAYVSGAISFVGVWLNAGVFVFLLCHGYGLLSYVYANLIGLPVRAIATLLAVLRSTRRPKLRLVMPLKEDLKDIFIFTSWIFISALVLETLAALPTLLIAKFVGLGAIALFYISFRPAFFLQRLSILPFQSLAPRWQELYLRGELVKLREEYVTGVFLTLQSGFALCTCFIVFLKPFLTVWVGAKMYSGTLVTTSLGFYLAVYLMANTLGMPFLLAKKIGVLAGVQIVELILALPVCIFMAEKFGAGGVIGGSVFLTALLSVQYIWRKGPECLGFECKMVDLLRGHAAALSIQLVLVCLAVMWVWWADHKGISFRGLLIGGGVIGATSVAHFCYSVGGIALRLVRKRRV